MESTRQKDRGYRGKPKQQDLLPCLSHSRVIETVSVAVTAQQPYSCKEKPRSIVQRNRREKNMLVGFFTAPHFQFLFMLQVNIHKVQWWSTKKPKKHKAACRRSVRAFAAWISIIFNGELTQEPTAIFVVYFILKTDLIISLRIRYWTLLVVCGIFEETYREENGVESCNN